MGHSMKKGISWLFFLVLALFVSICLFLFYGWVVAGYISSTWLLRQLMPAIKWLRAEFGETGRRCAQGLVYTSTFLIDSVAVGLFSFLPSLLIKSRVRLIVFLFIMIIPIMFPNIRYGFPSPSEIKGWALIAAPLAGIVCFALLGRVVRRKLILHFFSPSTGFNFNIDKERQ